MNYRAEIDGLRAFAVIPVIFFHAGFELFNGGFIGVDIFFVISGYLITSIIISEIAEGKFKIINFYERRARRILPALFFALFISGIAAPFFLLPDQIKDLGQSFVAIGTFLSNYFFYIELDYFNEFSKKNPLLHTWSLAVEEQFYLIFPLILLLIQRLGVKAHFFSLGCILAISFISAVILSSTNITLAFYSLHTRAWELMAGAIVGLYLFHNKQSIDGFIERNSLAVFFMNLLSIIFIIGSFILFSKQILHPSYLTIIPVFSTAFLILFLREGNLIFQMLSNRILVSIGLISYSLYLIHNIFFAYIDIEYDYLSNNEVTLVKLIWIPAIFLISIFSYKFVEQPFRNKSLTSLKVFSISAICLLGIIFTGLFTHLKNGFSQEILAYDLSRGIKPFVDADYEKKRIDAIEAKLGYHSNNAPVCVNEEKCKKIVVVGDSFARDTYLSLASTQQDFNVNFFSLDDSCIESFLSETLGIFGQCNSQTVSIEDYKLMIEDASYVLITNKWVETTLDQALKLAKYTTNFTSARVSLVDSILFANLQTLHRKIDIGENNLSDLGSQFFNYIRQDRLATSIKLKNLVLKEDDLNFISRYEFFCNSSARTCKLIDNKGKPLIWDNGHLSVNAYKAYSQYLLSRM